MRDKVVWLLLIFAVIYIAGNIGTGSLSTWDEALYANVSANILKTGDWLIMHDRPEKLWFDKPPLYMWCTAVFYNIFGINEFSVRITSAIFGLATVLLAYVFSKRLYDQHIAILSALLLLATPHYLHFSKMGMMDVMLTFFIFLMVFLFWIGQGRPSYLFWSWVAFIFAYMAKGFAAIIGPAIILLCCVLSGNMRIFIKRQFIIGILVSIIAVVIWHLTQYIVAGPKAINDYFGLHIFQRATTSLEGHSGGLNFYQKVIFNKNKPWAVLFCGALIYMLWLTIKNKDKRAILLISWAVAVFVICSMVHTKLHWYIMSIYPALAIASAVTIGKIFRKVNFSIILFIIFLAMIVQVPISWAFKLDFNAKVKAASLRMEKLQYEDNGSIFYYDAVKRKINHLI